MKRLFAKLSLIWSLACLTLALCFSLFYGLLCLSVRHTSVDAAGALYSCDYEMRVTLAIPGYEPFYAVVWETYCGWEPRYEIGSFLSSEFYLMISPGPPIALSRDTLPEGELILTSSWVIDLVWRDGALIVNVPRDKVFRFLRHPRVVPVVYSFGF
jgi:hypothetical protein